MKAKISCKELCFKITTEELNLLKGGKILHESLQIGRRKFSIAIDPVAVNNDFLAVLDDSCIRLLVSEAKIKELFNMGRSKKGLAGNQEGLKISLQVDLRTDRSPGKKDREE